MAAALLTEPWQKKFYSLTGMNKENPVWVFFQRVRTFVLVSAGFVLFRSDSLKMAGEIFKGMFSGNAGQLAAEGLGVLGLNGADGAVLLLSLGLWGQYPTGKKSMEIRKENLKSEERYVRSWHSQS